MHRVLPATIAGKLVTFLLSLVTVPWKRPTVHARFGQGFRKWKGDSYELENSNRYRCDPVVLVIRVRRHTGSAAGRILAGSCRAVAVFKRVNRVPHLRCRKRNPFAPPQ